MSETEKSSLQSGSEIAFGVGVGSYVGAELGLSVLASLVNPSLIVAGVLFVSDQTNKRVLGNHPSG